MAGVNKVILVGRLGKDPELKYGQTSNVAVCRFSLATDEYSRGEKKTEWHNIVCFDKLAEIANEYLSKGRQVYIEGRIQTRKWQDQNGNNRQITEIVAHALQMLGNRGDRSASETPDDDPFSGDASSPSRLGDDDMPF